MPKLKRLKVVRESKFLTQRELAEKSGIHQATIARLESQDVDGRITTARKLAEALGVKPEELVGAP